MPVGPVADLTGNLLLLSSSQRTVDVFVRHVQSRPLRLEVCKKSNWGRPRRIVLSDKHKCIDNENPARLFFRNQSQ